MDENTAATDPQSAPIEGAVVEEAQGGAELEALRAQIDTANDKYLRLAAEYDNYRKRTMKERQEERGRAQADLVKLLMDPLDDLTRFANVDVASANVPMMVEGAALVARKVFKELTAGGLTVIDPADQVFDPALHEAVTTQPAASAEQDDTVGAVYQVGYMYNGMLLRPARVVVRQWNG
ncbi:MAG TPA: nucleotide exchange factor GrpE [Gemmatimonadaceae bacterium]|nr:nucleotide exchange factor GrpE [Gemmatimonadaceae bacterium]